MLLKVNGLTDMAQWMETLPIPCPVMPFVGMGSGKVDCTSYHLGEGGGDLLGLITAPGDRLKATQRSAGGTDRHAGQPTEAGVLIRGRESESGRAAGGVTSREAHVTRPTAGR